MRSMLLLVVLCHPMLAFCQTRDAQKVVQISLVPGISTDGLHPGGFNNFFSINLTSGYSAANYVFEVGVISNLNVNETRGIQLAGIANITGSNAYEGLTFKQIEKKKKEGFEANLSGLQFAGVSNVVLNNVFGGQFSSGFNIAKGALIGVQVSGMGNTIGKYTLGVQISGGYNVSKESMDGVQIASLFNITEGGLSGTQMSLLNVAGFIEGKNSYQSAQHTALQFGAMNYCRSMNGFQIGLVNVGKRMQGTQIGLINIFRNGKTPETRDGTSIGLINIGSSGYFSCYASEVFPVNIEIATGTVKNRRMANERNEKQVQNALIYSRSIDASKHWAFGYGIKKLYFNKSASPGMSRMKFLSGGVDLLQVNRTTGKLDKQFNLISRPHVTIGSRIHPKNKVFFFFASVAYNFYSGDDAIPILSEGRASVGQRRSWPGGSVGVLVQ
jgi:hypothetical protein